MQRSSTKTADPKDLETLKQLQACMKREGFKPAKCSRKKSHVQHGGTG